MGKVIHQLDTSEPEPVPAQEHLWRRNGVYYFRMRLPRELKRSGVSFMVEGREQKHEIKFSLKTHDHRKAGSLVAMHAAIWRAQFDSKLAEIEDARHQAEAKKLLLAVGVKSQSLASKTLPSRPLIVFSDERIQATILRLFIARQRESKARVEALRGAPMELREDAAHDIATEVSGIAQDVPGAEYDFHRELRWHLLDMGLEDTSLEQKTYDRLFAGYREGRIEDAWRTVGALKSGRWEEANPAFKGIHADTPLPDEQREMTLAELITEFEKSQRAKRVSPKTHRANAPVFCALREHFGESMPIGKITQQGMTVFFDFVDSIPAHAPQRYKGKSLRDAALLENALTSPRRLEHRTKANYHGRAVAMFQYALEMGMLPFNPANIPPLQARFHVEKKSDRPPFSVHELTKIFHAPIYTGCVDDVKGWYKRGATVAKRGRFWVPLLALFQALRCNEACQLETSDIFEEEGVPCINVTDESDDDGNKDGKSVKTSASKAKVPIHPMIVQMGFLEFVEDRRRAGDGSSLFPELPRKSDGSYADIFSKWFNRFLDKTFEGSPPKGTFHSFRHSFRDATRRAKLHPEIADRLGRWSSPTSVGRMYGHGFTMAELRAELAKVAFPGVNFIHLLLYTESGCPVRYRGKPVE